MQGFFKKIQTEHILSTFVVIGLLVYGRTLLNGFVGDDMGYIQHPYIQQTKLVELFQSGSADLGGNSPITGQFFRPIMLVTIALVYVLFSDNAFFYHLLQLIFHVANVILVFFLFRKFFSQYISAILSLIYLVHPINVETVAYISDIQDVFFVFFGLCALTILIYQPSKKTITWYIPSLLFFSLLSKETGLLFIGILFLYLFLFQKQYNKHFIISVSVIILFYSLIRFFIAGVGLGNAHNAVLGYLSFWERLMHIPRIFLYYLQTVVFPKDLAIAQTWRIDMTFQEIVFPLFLFILFCICTTWLYVYLKKKFKKESSVFLFFSVWFFMGMVLHMQILPLEMTVADRWFYFPFIGLLGMGGTIIYLLPQQNKVYLFLVNCLIIVLLSLRTFYRIGDWKDPITLYTHDSIITKSYLLEHSLGYEYLQQNNLPKAFIHLQKAVDIFPTSQNTNSFGVYYYRTGNTHEAEKWFTISIELGDNFLAYNNLSRLLLSQKSEDTAISILHSATKKFPQSSNFWYLLALAQYQKGNHQNALSAAKKAYELSPNQQNGYVFHQLQLGLPIQITE